MVELERALGRLADDPAMAPEDFPAIVARAERRRRRRWQGRGGAAVVGLVAVVLGVAALLPGPAGQVVDTANRPGGGRGVPATVGGASPAAATVVAEGDVVGGGHWRLLARPGDKGLCLDVEYGGRASSECGQAVGAGAGQAIAGGLSSGLDATFVSGPVRKDVAAVRVEHDGDTPVDLVPVGTDRGFEVNFFVSPVAAGQTPTRAIALDPLGLALGEVGFRSPPDPPPGDEIAAPSSPTTSLEPENGVPPTTPADPDGSQSSPIQPIPSDPIVPPGGDPSLAACPPADVAVTVTTGKASYAPGETVTGSSTLENRSSTACLVPARVRWAVQDLAGNDVSGFAYTADYALPVKAEPGQSFPGTFSWNQNDCRDVPCVPVAPGTYVLVGRWSEGGSFSAQATFQVGP